MMTSPGGAPNPAPDPPATPQSDPQVQPSPATKAEEATTKSRELKVAMYGLIVSLIVAVLSTATTLVVTIVTANNASDMSVDEFKRREQQTAYVEFVTALNDSQITLIEYFYSAGQYSDENMPAFRSFSDAQSVLMKEMQTLKLVGSDEALTAAERVMDAWEKANNLSGRTVLEAESGSVLSDEQVDEMNRYLADVSARQDELIEVARCDIQAFSDDCDDD